MMGWAIGAGAAGGGGGTGERSRCPVDLDRRIPDEISGVR